MAGRRDSMVSGRVRAAHAAASVSSQVRDVIGQAIVADDRPALVTYAGIVLASALAAWCLVVGPRPPHDIISKRSKK
jgi:hypothetical protein